MRIVIDMQGAQTESRYRGIGRYTLSFARAVVQNRGEHEVILALSGLFPDTIAPIRAAFAALLPAENIRVWYAPAQLREGEAGTEQASYSLRRSNAELIREAFLVSLQPDVIHLCSLFEGYSDDAVVSVGRFDQRTPVSVTLHDLIPLVNPQHYFDPHPRYAQYYQRKLAFLQQAAVCLTISEFSQQEGIAHLPGLRPAQIINTSSAIDPRFQLQTIAAPDADRLRSKLSLTRPFVLYAGGGDERKNLPRLIHAYAALPAPLRSTHQLVLAGKMQPEEQTQLQQAAQTAGLAPHEWCLTGYITDTELLQLYHLCQLFVFPSWHEGFGLPALEAMACGAPVIGANTSSLPEVIGRSDALFDPLDAAAISAAIARALGDEPYRADLRRHGLQQAQKFSWPATAQRAIAAWESLAPLPAEADSAPKLATGRPSLIFVTPLPPDRTGIADYSAELLPALAQHYDIDVVLALPSAAPPAHDAPYRVRDMEWFFACADSATHLPRVVYQFGNSPFHSHMFQALAKVPGLVVLHDFFLSSVIRHMDEYGGLPGQWARELYHSHGYLALQQRCASQDYEVQTIQYPCSRSVLENSLGLIFHSAQSVQLLQQWYGPQFAKNIDVIPLLRAPAPVMDKAAARQQLGFAADDFVVCSFGFLGPSKLNHRLLQAWLHSELLANPRCTLVFVGENHGGDYGAELLATMRASGAGERLRITGFATADSYRLYLAAADAAVQLRTHSRGETSAAVLDCMNHALPVIVNANGSMAELDPSAVWLLPDEFADDALIDALHTLWRQPERRTALGQYAHQVIATRHAPAYCAQRYAQAIERAHACAQYAPPQLVQAIAAQPAFAAAAPSDAELQQLSQAIAATLPTQRAGRRLLLDVSATRRNDLKTGIERVVRALLLALLHTPPPGYRIEPVYLQYSDSDSGSGWHHRSACSYTLGLLGARTNAVQDDAIEPENGDTLFILDLSHDITQPAAQTLLARYRQRGVRVHAVVYDLLPVRMPEVFPPQADHSHAQWLQAISHLDGAVCISRAVADDLAAWRAQQQPQAQTSAPPAAYAIDWFHLGADLSSSAPSQGLPANAPALLAQLRSRPSFLMVGTIEPRKGYLQAIEAFSQLWQQGADINLVIVGREGWQGLPTASRRDIPATIERLHKHPESGQRLHWLDGISDEYLDLLYAHSTCLLAASYGEGFGLPLIEAAQHRLPILARNIAVFQEVAGAHASYFDAATPAALAQAVQHWLQQHANDPAHRPSPQSADMPWLTWDDSAAQLLQRLLPLDISKI